MRRRNSRPSAEAIGKSDYLILSSDSGRLSILEFLMSPTPHFVSLYQETYGKSGARRMVPGQWLAADPRGRSVMVGAIEKAKLVYVLNRNAEGKLFPSSPLEAHKANAIISAMIGVDVGYDNPMYACLETSYEESDQDWTGEAYERTEKMLTFYELDLGLNHVVRKSSEPVDKRANMLVQGELAGPGSRRSRADRKQCLEDRMQRQIDSTDRRACSCVPRITSHGDTLTHRRTAFRSQEDGTRSWTLRRILAS